MLVVIAQKEELKLVEELGYGDYPIMITGVGGMNVIRALKDLPKNTEIINIGYCGSNCLEVGTTVSISSVYTLHENADFVDAYACCFANRQLDAIAPCYTSTDFVTKTKIKNNCVFDMELAFICAMFDRVYAIKVVSDNLNKKEYDEKVEEEN